MIDKYTSSKLLAISFLLKIIVVVSHSANLVLNIRNESTVISGTLNSFIQNVIAKGLSSVAVPTLFIISGYLFFVNLKTSCNAEFTDKFKKRIKTLVVPYLFWSLFGILFYFILQSIPYSKPFFTKGLVANFSLSKWLYTVFYLPVAAQLWFIRDLIVLVLFTPLFYKLLKFVSKLFLIACFLVWYFEVRLFLFSSGALFFFSMGSYMGVQKIRLREIAGLRHSWLLLLLWIALEVFKTLLTENGVYVQWLIILMHNVAIITGIAALWFCYDGLYKNTDITKKRYYSLFKYSFWIYVTHQPLLNIIKKGLYAALVLAILIHL